MDLEAVRKGRERCTQLIDERTRHYLNIPESLRVRYFNLEVPLNMYHAIYLLAEHSFKMHFDNREELKGFSGEQEKQTSKAVGTNFSTKIKQHVNYERYLPRIDFLGAESPSK